jgi:hypothetical protein
MSTNSIPITINGIRFRSLIEARWAEMFSRLGWEWEYEPIELNGYIPDFIIKFPYKHLLVEVKGETNMENIEQYAEKIINSGWDGEFLLVCSTLGYADGIYIGLLGSTKFSYSWKGWPCDNDMPIKPKIKNADFAHLSTCNGCKTYTIYSDVNGWFCRNCGDGCSNKVLPKNRIKKDEEERILEKKCDNCEQFQLWWSEYKEKNARRCPCGKIIYMCKSCNLCPYIGGVTNCSCIYKTIYKVRYNQIYTFWNEAKNSSQWKPK